MYAIIETGGKQLKVEENSVIRVELLDSQPGDAVRFKALMVQDGETTRVAGDVADAYAEGVVLRSGRGRKLNIFTYKAKKNERRRKGHRQPFTEVRISGIFGSESKK